MSSISMYELGGWLFAGIGVCLMMIGLFARRIVVQTSPTAPNAATHSPMSPPQMGVIICPECGRTPIGPTETYTMRGRKLAVLVGAGLIIASIALPMTPTIRNQGWRSAVPLSIQIRLWPSGTSQDRSRIEQAYRNGKLSRANVDRLRTTLRQVLADPNSTRAELQSVASYFNPSAGNTVLLDESNTEFVIRDEKSPIRRQAIQDASRSKKPPQTQGLREARRQAAWASNASGHSTVLKWLIEYPSDDEADQETIRTLITESHDSIFWPVHSAFEYASAAQIELAISLLDDQSAKVRQRALKCISENMQGRQSVVPEHAAKHILAMINDPDPSTRWTARILIENLPISAEPLLDELLRSTRDPKTLNMLIHGAIRRTPDAVGLMPALAAIARNKERSLRTRLEAADAYTYIRRRARATTEPEDLWPAYDALVLALAHGDFNAAFAYGEEMRSNQNPWAVGAIARLMLAEGVAPEEMNEWFSQRSGVAGLLGIWYPLIDDPVERFELALAAAIKPQYLYSSERVPEVAAHAIEFYFSSESENSSSLEPSAP